MALLNRGLDTEEAGMVEVLAMTDQQPALIIALVDDERIHVAVEVDTGLSPDGLSMSALFYRAGNAFGDGLAPGFQEAAHTIETTGHVVEDEVNVLEAGDDD